MTNDQKNDLITTRTTEVCLKLLVRNGHGEDVMSKLVELAKQLEGFVATSGGFVEAPESHEVECLVEQLPDDVFEELAVKETRRFKVDDAVAVRFEGGVGQHLCTVAAADDEWLTLSPMPGGDEEPIKFGFDYEHGCWYDDQDSGMPAEIVLIDRR